MSDYASLRKRLSGTLAKQRTRAGKFYQHLDYNVDNLVDLVLAAVDRPCPLCREPLHLGNFSFDHAVPVSRRGSFRLSNLVVLCARCNERKGALNLEEYTQLIDLVRSWPADAANDVLRRLRHGGGRWNK